MVSANYTPSPLQPGRLCAVHVVACITASFVADWTRVVDSWKAFLQVAGSTADYGVGGSVVCWVLLAYNPFQIAAGNATRLCF